jgi:hypothetical protein
LVVLLVYGPVGEPVSLVLDGRDGQTQLFIVNDAAGNADGSTVEMIERALKKTIAGQTSCL